MSNPESFEDQVNECSSCIPAVLQNNQENIAICDCASVLMLPDDLSVDGESADPVKVDVRVDDSLTVVAVCDTTEHMEDISLINQTINDNAPQATNSEHFEDNDATASDDVSLAGQSVDTATSRMSFPDYVDHGIKQIVLLINKIVSPKNSTQVEFSTEDGKQLDFESLGNHIAHSDDNASVKDILSQGGDNAYDPNEGQDKHSDGNVKDQRLVETIQHRENGEEEKSLEYHNGDTRLNNIAINDDAKNYGLQTVVLGDNITPSLTGTSSPKSPADEAMVETLPIVEGHTMASGDHSYCTNTPDNLIVEGLKHETMVEYSEPSKALDVNNATMENSDGLEYCTLDPQATSDEAVKSKQNSLDEISINEESGEKDEDESVERNYDIDRIDNIALVYHHVGLNRILKNQYRDTDMNKTRLDSSVLATMSDDLSIEGRSHDNTTDDENEIDDGSCDEKHDFSANKHYENENQMTEGSNDQSNVMISNCSVSLKLKHLAVTNLTAVQDLCGHSDNQHYIPAFDEDSRVELPNDLSLDDSSEDTVTSSNKWNHRPVTYEVEVSRQVMDDTIPTSSSKDNLPPISPRSPRSPRSPSFISDKNKLVAPSFGDLYRTDQGSRQSTDDFSISGETVSSANTWYNRLATHETISTKRMKDRAEPPLPIREERPPGAPSRFSDSYQRDKTVPIHERLYKTETASRSYSKSPIKNTVSRSSISGNSASHRNVSDDLSVSGETVSSANTWYHRLAYQETESSRRLKDRTEPSQTVQKLIADDTSMTGETVTSINTWYHRLASHETESSRRMKDRTEAPAPYHEERPNSPRSPRFSDSYRRSTTLTVHERLHKTDTVSRQFSKSPSKHGVRGTDTLNTSDGSRICKIAPKTSSGGSGGEIKFPLSYKKKAYTSSAEQGKSLLREKINDCLFIAYKSDEEEKRFVHLLDLYLMGEGVGCEAREPCTSVNERVF